MISSYNQKRCGIFMNVSFVTVDLGLEGLSVEIRLMVKKTAKTATAKEAMYM